MRIRLPLRFIAVALLFVSACAHLGRRGTEADNYEQICAVESLLARGGTLRAERCATWIVEDKAPDSQQKFIVAELLLATGRPNLAFDVYRSLLLGEDLGASPLATAAMMSLIAARDRIADFGDRITDLGGELRAEKTELPPAFWYELNNMQLAVARQKGDTAAQAEHLEALGFITGWSTLGPIGPLAWEYLDRRHPLEDADRWQQKVQLGPGRTASSVFQPAHFLGRLRGGDPSNQSHGTVLGRAVVQAKRSGRAWFRLETGSSFVLRVDGHEVIRTDRRAENPPLTNWLWVELDKGTHLIELKLAGRSPTSPFSLAAYGQGGRPMFDTRVDLEAPDHSADRSPKLVFGQDRAPYATAGEKLAGLRIALWYDDHAQLQRIAGELTDEQRVALPVREALAEGALIDPERPADMSYEHSRARFEQTLADEPHSVTARIQIARHHAVEDRLEVAIALLREGIALSPHEPLFHSKLVGAYVDARWYAEARAALTDLRRLLPNSCEPLRWDLALARTLEQRPKVRRIAESLVACDRLSTEYLDSLIESRDWELAMAEQQRLAALFPLAPEIVGRGAVIASALGETQLRTDALVKSIELEPAYEEHHLQLADWHRSRGDLPLARQALLHGAALVKAPSPSLDKAASALNGTTHLAPHRIDGLTVIDEYRHAAPGYTSAAVYVLDRAIYIYAPDGSHTVIVHTITEVNSTEAITALGELELPAHADLLRVRVIGLDGDLKEPVYIEGKASLSLPNLQPGDLIEVEYASYNTPNLTYPGGFDTERFFFQDFFTAFHRSEMIVVAPRDMTLQHDPRGDCPKAVRSFDGDRQVITYRAVSSRPHNDEVAGPNPLEYLPSARVGSGINWPNVTGRLSDMLADRSVPAQTLDAVVEAACPGARMPDCARALYRFVTSEIEHDPDLFEQASYILSRRSGHRTRLLAALMTSAGIQSDFALVHPSTGDQSAGALPSLGDYNEVALKLEDGTWLFPEIDQSPWGYLPPRLRKRPAVLLSDGTLLRTSAGIIERDREQVHVHIENPLGESTRLEITETFEGQTAIDWRGILHGGEGADIERWFQENYLSDVLPGAVLTSLRFENLDAPDQPLVIEYAATAEDYTRASRGHSIARALFETRLIDETGGLPRRSTDLVMAAHYERSVKVSWKLAKGLAYEIPMEGSSLILETQFGRLHMQQERSGSTVGYVYTFNLTQSRIGAGEYEAFSAFARQVDRATAVEPSFRQN